MIKRLPFSRKISAALVLLISLFTSTGYAPKSTVLTNPIMFVTVPPGDGFLYQLQTFANHTTSFDAAPRGGDLWIMYPDGTLRNLTKEAGFGSSTDLQADNAIAVRQPTIHWSGTKALFSMVIGGPTSRYDVNYEKNRWQIYEITGFNQGGTVKITKVPGQPAYNNVSPVYASDDKILFTSDAPLFGMAHTYPQRDEYESTVTVTGVWKLDPATGKTTMIEHAPSGAFDLFVDSFGRVLFTKWDHLKRDQQADADRYDGGNYHPVDIADESATAGIKSYPQTVDGKPYADSKGVLYDIFPEARHAKDPTRDPNEPLHDFNQFMIWEVNEDGSEEEVINHAGRDEFGGTYMEGSKIDDPNLTYIFSNYSKNPIRSTFRADAGLFQIKEDPNQPGTYYTTYSEEFGRIASGRILEFSLPPGKNPEEMVMIDWTNATLDDDPNGVNPPTADMTGHYRNPLMMQNGTMLVSHDPEYRLNSKNKYILRIKPMVKRFPTNTTSTEHIGGTPLTGTGISKTITYWNGEAQPTTFYSGVMSEVDIVEVRARTRPVARTNQVAAVEKQVLIEENVDEATLRKWLTDHKMALIVSRNVTQRDRADVHQPFNLRVPNGVSSIATSGKVYDISHLQLFQADLLRAYKSYDGQSLQNGRRVYVNTLHNTTQHPDVDKVNVRNPAGPKGSMKIGLDGSFAAFVPAGRALTWQTTDDTGKGIVRERNWLTFAPGEIRTCAGCHGINAKSQTNLSEPQNKPEALRELLKQWKNMTGDVVLGTETSQDNFQLKNYPNPVTTATTILYRLDAAGHVRLTIYDPLGREVKVLTDAQQDAGVHEVMWNGSDATGGQLRTGLYTAVLYANGHHTSLKMLLIR